jgi:hypothetical protein
MDDWRQPPEHDEGHCETCRYRDGEELENDDGTSVIRCPVLRAKQKLSATDSCGEYEEDREALARVNEEARDQAMDAPDPKDHEDRRDDY